MDLREKIAEIIAAADGRYEHADSDAIADAVMGVVEEDAAKRRAYTERREDENQRMRDAMARAVEFAWTTPKGTLTARYEKVLDHTSDMGPWWLTVPWRPIKGGHIENFHDRDAALSRAREISEEEA